MKEKKRNGYSKLYYNSKKNKDIELNCLQEIILEYFPDYEKSFNCVMHRNKSTWGNMFIIKKRDFDDYCEWLFEFLRLFDERIKEIQNPVRPRIDGYMSEMLLPVWFEKRFKKNQIYRIEVRSTEREFPEFIKGIKGTIIRFIRTNKPLLDFVYWIMNI